jgi:hypothetical protein
VALLKSSGKLEVAQQIANHESPQTKLYDRRYDEISLDEIERIDLNSNQQQSRVRRDPGPWGPWGVPWFRSLCAEQGLAIRSMFLFCEKGCP